VKDAGRCQRFIAFHDFIIEKCYETRGNNALQDGFLKKLDEL